MIYTVHDILVNLGKRSYNIHIALDSLQDIGSLVAGATRAVKLLLVSNPTVFQLYGSQVLDSLGEKGYEVKHCLMPDGERFKTLGQASAIIDQALEWELDRSSAVLALGGGVVGDLAGFVAAVVHRGIDFIQVPTSLLAQVDSSVGGKVAVNHAKGKNLIGAFHQPRLVVIDPSTLQTLEDAEFKSGLGEVVKYGIAYEKGFFEFLEASSALIIDREWGCIEKMIAQSCRIKSAVVEEDEHELGLRMILNLGHTFGHSLEMLGGYEQYRHGEAVVMGTIAAGCMAEELGLITIDELQRIKKLYLSLGLAVKFPPYRPQEVYEGMKNDKKVSRNRLRFVVPVGIGNYKIIEDPPIEQIYRAISRAQED